MANRQWIIRAFQGVFLVVIFLAMIGMFGMIWWINNSQPPAAIESMTFYQPAPTSGSDLRAAEGDAEIKIPASARNIYATISGAQAIDVWVRLDLPAGDLPEFLANARCQSPLAAEDPNAYAPSKPNANARIGDWWQPYKAARLEGCSGIHDFLHQTILVDKTRNDIFIIYIYSATDDFRTRPAPTSRP